MSHAAARCQRVFKRRSLRCFSWVAQLLLNALQETNFEVYDGGQVARSLKLQGNSGFFRWATSGGSSTPPRRGTTLMPVGTEALGRITGVNADSDQFHVDFKEARAWPRRKGIQVQSPQWKAALIAMALFLAARQQEKEVV